MIGAAEMGHEQTHALQHHLRDPNRKTASQRSRRIRSGASIRLRLRPFLTPRNQPDHSEAARERVEILSRWPAMALDPQPRSVCHRLRCRLHRGRPLAWRSISPSCRGCCRNRRPIVASRYTALCITQDDELIRILPAQRVVYAARNIEPVVVWPLLFHLKQRRHNFTTAS
jgi:hypothetical protein